MGSPVNTLILFAKMLIETTTQNLKARIRTIIKHAFHIKK